MSSVKYGGITLDLIGTERYHKEAVFHGPHYLYTRHVLEFSAVLNVNLNAYSLIAGVPVSSNNQVVLAPLTDKAIRHFLMQPHRQFVYTVAGVDTIFSPRAGTVCDATNGPFPLYCDVVRVTPKTWWVKFGIRTDLNECGDYTKNAQAPVVLSHLWESQEDIDQDFYSVRVTRGRAVFNMEQVRTQDLRPDDFRNALGHPVPPGFRRDKVEVRLTDDESTLEYTLIDRQTAVDIVIRDKCTRIEAIHTQTITTPGLERMFVGIASDIADALVEGAAVAGQNPNPVVGLPAEIGITTIRTAQRIGQRIYNTIPVRLQDVIVRVWGNRNADRRTLNGIAERIIISRVTNNGGNAAFFLRVGFAGVRFSMTHDVMGKFVELHCQTLGAPITDAITIAEDALAGGLFPATDDVPGVTRAGPALFADANPASPGGPMRGVDLRSLAMNALSDPCEIPETPTLPPQSLFRDLE